MKLRLCNKTEEDYALFSQGFHEIFEPKYFIDKNTINPFKAKDNIYLYAHDEDGAFMGALNLVFLTQTAFHILKKGDVVDDMFLSIDDIQPLHLDPPHEKSKVYAYFSTVFVKPDFRGRGVAMALVQHAIRWLTHTADEREISYLAYCLNDASRALFEQNGLKVIGKNLNDEWILNA